LDATWTWRRRMKLGALSHKRSCSDGEVAKWSHAASGKPSAWRIALSQLSYQAKYRPGTLVADGTDLCGVFFPQVVEPHCEIDDGLDFIERGAGDSQVFAKFLVSPAACAFRDVEHDAGGGPAPLISQATAFGRWESVDQRLRNDRQ